MHNYKITVRNIKARGRETIDILEFIGCCLTVDDFRRISQLLFFWSCQAIKYNKTLVADVERDGKRLFEVRCDTDTDGAFIWCSLFIGRPRDHFRYYRSMIIAEIGE